MDLNEALARISALEADNRTLAETAQRSDAEAKAAKDALTAFSAARRSEEVVGLFAALGREHSPEAAAPYLAMDETTFAAIAADLRKAGTANRPEDAVLFADQATGDPATNTEAAREKNAALIASYI